MGTVLTKDMLPSQIVQELDKHIVGQTEAKKAVAISLRNRWRRQRLAKEMADEVIPKNILMIGPTGVGKTEIARRLAKLADAPFIKVEATKFTEVGYHGRDVDMIVRDLADIAVHDYTEKVRAQERENVRPKVEERLLDLLVGSDARGTTRESFRAMLRSGALEARMVEIEVVERPKGMGMGGDFGGPGMQANVEQMLAQFQSIFPARKVKKLLPVSECRPIIEEQEAERVLNKEQIVAQAVRNVEHNGIVFIDEIDKICTKPGDRQGGDASAEGVQRDLLPLIEGTVVSTKYGNVDTTKILFVASGAFHSCKPSDLLAELQGRLPVRVQLKPLKKEDFHRILTETKFNLIEQAVALMATENITLEFKPEAIYLIAKLTEEINQVVENIGARRLHTVMERILEDISYDCKAGSKILIDEAYVMSRLSELVIKTDLSRFIL